MTLIGGEAMLDLERTLQIGKIALSHGIPKVEIDTGASWANSVEIARDVLKRILDAGLSLGAVSVDSFHQKHVPQENLMNLFLAARDLGIVLKGSCAVIEQGVQGNPYDEESSELIRWFSNHGVQIDTFPVVFQGRAVNLAQYHSGIKSIPQDKCPGVYFFATEDWRNPGGIQIDVNGYVMLEHGICIGNTREKDLSDILDSFDAETHPIISVLLKDGPIGLTRLPESEGFKLQENGYTDKCHLCQDIRTYLRPQFPEILCPDSYYPPIQNRGHGN